MPHRAPGCASGATNQAILPRNALPCPARMLTSPPFHGLTVDMTLRHLGPTAVSAMPLRRVPLLNTPPGQLLPTAASATLLLLDSLLGKPPRWTTVVLGRRERPKGLVAPPQQAFPLPRTSPRRRVLLVWNRRTATTARMMLTS